MRHTVFAHIVVRLTFTYVISAHHHLICQLVFCTCSSVLNRTLFNQVFQKLVEDLRFFLGTNCIVGVMVNMFAMSAVDHTFKPHSGQTTDYKIGICCFSAKYTVLKSKSKDSFAWIQDNVCEWSDMSTCRLLFQSDSTTKVSSRSSKLASSLSHGVLLVLVMIWLKNCPLNNNHLLTVFFSFLQQ